MSGTQQGRQKVAQQPVLVGRYLQNGLYAVEKVLGHGGMGKVLLAAHAELDVPVALKQARADSPLPESVIEELERLLHTEGAPSQDFYQSAFNDFPLSGGTQTDRFLREALLLARLHHPAIPKLYDYFFEDGYWYLVMEYVPGPTLAAYMRQHAPLSPLEAINYAMQLCDVLDYLHGQAPPVIFRDLKPSNIIITPEGRLVLVDFGIARYFKEGQVNDTTDFGSPGYASPEQFEGSGQTDARSDLFSLGIILYEMLCGHRPVKKGANRDIFEPLQHLNPALSTALCGLVTVAIRPEPAYRFQTAHAFYIALKRSRTLEELRLYSQPAQQRELPASTRHAGEEALRSVQGGDIQAESPTGEPLVPQGGKAQHTRRRKALDKGGREKLEQEALSLQLVSIDAALQERVTASMRKLVSNKPLHPVQVEDEHDAPTEVQQANISTGQASTGQYTSRKPGIHRIVRVCFLFALLLALLMTSLFAYNRFSPRRSGSLNSATAPTQIQQLPQPGEESTWQILPSLPSPEADNTATYVQVGGHAYIYVSGGYRGFELKPAYSRELFRYDITAAHWETVGSKGFPGMGNNAAALDEHNDLFFTAGYSPDTYRVTSLLYRYRPEDGTLRKIVPPAAIAFGFGATMLADQQGHLYISQGFMIPGNPHTVAGRGWYRYDIASGQWHTLAPLPLGLGYVVLAPDGRGGILMLGGSRDAGQHLPTQQVYRYDIQQNTWTLEQATAPMPLSGVASCLDGQGHLVIIGGYDYMHNTSLDSAWRFDLHTLQWQALPPLPSGGSLLGAAACDGMGHIYLERGANTTTRPTADFLELTIQK
jgi:serine/threonine protein kinase